MAYREWKLLGTTLIDLLRQGDLGEYLVITFVVLPQYLHNLGQLILAVSYQFFLHSFLMGILSRFLLPTDS